MQGDVASLAGYIWLGWFLLSGALTVIGVVIFRYAFKNDWHYITASLSLLGLCVFSWMLGIWWLGTV